MKNLFKKYFQSVISPNEFDQFSDFINQKKNEPAIHRFMDDEWQRQSQETFSEKQNPLLLQKIKHTILNEELSCSLQRTKYYSLGLKIAAVLMVGLVIANVWLYRGQESGDEKQLVQTVSVPNRAKTEFELPDGSTVWLNAGTTISYAANFEKNRTVELRGEAFFDVVKSKNTFSVKTKSGSVAVLGTAFNVQAYEEGEFTTTLERGRVEILNKKGTKLGILEPGDQVQLVDNQFVKDQVDTRIYTSWKDGKLIFVRETFPVAMRRLERWFNVDIQYSSDDFEGPWFSGTFENETISEAMDIICKTASVTYSYNSKKRIIKISALKK